MPSPLEGFKRQKANPLLRIAFKLPVLMYHGPIASLMSSRCVMVITATGRKSGLPRTNGVSYMKFNGNYISFSGWGVSSNWYRNVVANPEVTLRVGRKTIHVTAHPVTDPDRRISLMLRMREQSKHCGPPQFIRPLLRLSHTFNYENEINMAVDHAEELPIVEFVPHGD
ncbi:MAG: nitroreductase family deazaflavin-dependent oxidoreductase [Nitrolancea sp.]